MVNNAGIAGMDNLRPVWEYAEDGWDKLVAVNLKGVFLGCKYASNQMRQQDPHANGDRGWIINLASVLGLGGSPSNGKFRVQKELEDIYFADSR